MSIPSNPKSQTEIIAELEAAMLQAHEECTSIQAKADAEGRDKTDAEVARIEELDCRFQTAKADIEQRRKIMNQQAMLAAPAPSVTRPQPVMVEAAAVPQVAPYTGRRTVEYVEGPKSAWGWRSIGEFMHGVIKAHTGRGLDPRFQAAVTTYGSEGTSADGGYALPPDFRETIVKKMNGDMALLPLTEQLTTSSNKITIPFDATTPWQTSGGVLTAWTDEAAAITASKPALTQVEVQAYKLAALVSLSDELIEDVPALNAWLPGKLGEKFQSAISNAIMNGSGSGQPTGVIGSSGQVTVTAKSGQGAGTVVFENIVGMYARMHPQLVSQAVWLIHPAVLPQLLSLVGPGYSPGAWMPPGNTLANSPYGTLLGRPVYASEYCAALGTAGDIVFWAPKTYISVTKSAGLRSDTSIHFAFDQALTTVRATVRIGGKSLWAATVTPRTGAATYGNVIVLNSTRT
jgi:HK97 family phage major capsid protein